MNIISKKIENFEYISGNDIPQAQAIADIQNICKSVNWTHTDIRLSINRFHLYPDLALFVKDPEKNAIVGYAVMRPWESKTEKFNRYYISYIAIDSFYQRKGIGKTLLNRTLDVAKKIGAEKVKLDHDDTQTLNNFYHTSTLYPIKSKYIGKNRRNVEEKRLTYDLQQTDKTENQKQ